MYYVTSINQSEMRENSLKNLNRFKKKKKIKNKKVTFKMLVCTFIKFWLNISLKMIDWVYYVTKILNKLHFWLAPCVDLCSCFEYCYALCFNNPVLHFFVYHQIYPPCFHFIKNNTPFLNELLHDKTNKLTCAPSRDSDQPGHPSSLMRAFVVRMKKHWAFNYLLSEDWSDRADAQAGLSICWAHMSFCWFCRAAA